ncbi:TonB-dependent receptor domain-containing protein [Shimia biformata]|uniref:TonB-dependent receptor domain-containing protein n=1 Tax=Shimia biformata TaxID=1294299 RepID=UPI00194F69FA|nr:TonB-dependent receptor [Shimia biformata]
MKISLRGALLLGASFAFVGAAQADTEEEPHQLDEIRIEQADAQQVLGNLGIETEDIARRNPATITEVFDGESAINTSGGAAIAKKVFVNGVEESLLSVTIDGARQNKSAFHHTGNVLIDPALLKSVEVSSGLAPADAGPGGLGGSLAYTTKDARDLLEPGDDFGGRASVMAGSNGAGLRGNLALYGQSGGLDYLFSATRHKGEDYKDGDGVVVEGTNPDLTDYMGKLSYTTENGHRIALSASLTEDTGLRTAQAGPGGLLFTRPDFAGLTNGPSVLIPGYARRSSYALTYTKDNPDDWFDPFFQLAYNEQETDAGGVEGINTSLSGTFKNTFQLGNGTLTAGIDFFDEDAEGFTDAPFNFTGMERLRNIGLFAQARQDLTDAVSVSYGARYDHQNFDGADGSQFVDSGLSGNAAIDVRLTDTLTLNAGVASTFGGYNLGEAALVNFFTPWDYTGFTSSRSNSARIGLRFDNGNWVANGAVFHTQIDDLAAVLPTAGARGEITDLTSQGFDGSLGYFWDSGFARVKYTFSDVQSEGAPISSTAYYLGRPMGHIFALETAWQPAFGWTVGGTAQIAPEYAEADLDAYAVFNAFVEYVPPQLDNLRLRLDVRNLFDETYVARGSDAAGQVGRPIPLNEPGRTIMLAANVTF